MQQIEQLKSFYNQLEGIWQRDEDGTEFIYARDLQTVLGYTRWEKFQNPIEKAQDACKQQNIELADHFHHVVKMVAIGSETERKIDDIKLTRYAAYLIAMNGDPRKSEIAFAQNYFAVQTRRFEEIIERVGQIEHLEARQKLRESETVFSSVMVRHGIENKEIAYVRSMGDKEFFGGHDTRAMKQRLNVPEKSPLADHANTVVNSAKTLINNITSLVVERDDLQGKNKITDEHVKNSQHVRKTLTDSRIYPENLPAEQDIKKVAKKIEKDEKQLTSSPKAKAKK